MDLRSCLVHLGLPRPWSGGVRYRKFLNVNIYGFKFFGYKPPRKMPFFFDKSEVYVYVYVANTEMT